MSKYHFYASDEIACSADQLWATLVDFAEYPSWNPMIVELQGEARVGSKFKFSLRLAC